MLNLVEFEYQYQGSSFPTRILAADGKNYVLKMKGAGNGTKSLLQEFIVNKAASCLNFQVPDVHPVKIAADFPWRFGTDEFDDIVQKSFGVNLGINYIPNAKTIADLTLLPENSAVFHEMIAIDTFFRNFDRTQQSRNVIIDGSGESWLIDHGSCQFIDIQLSKSEIKLPINHVYAQLEVESNIPLMKLLAFDFAPVVNEIPAEWLLEVDMTYDHVWQLLADRKLYFAKCYGT